MGAWPSGEDAVVVSYIFEWRQERGPCADCRWCPARRLHFHATCIYISLLQWYFRVDYSRTTRPYVLRTCLIERGYGIKMPPYCGARSPLSSHSSRYILGYSIKDLRVCGDTVLWFAVKHMNSLLVGELMWHSLMPKTVAGQKLHTISLYFFSPYREAQLLGHIPVPRICDRVKAQLPVESISVGSRCDWTAWLLTFYVFLLFLFNILCFFLDTLIRIVQICYWFTPPVRPKKKVLPKW